MVVEILVRAITNDTGTRLKGNPVSIKPLNVASWGGRERPPMFAVVKIIDATSIDQIKQYVEIWRRRTTYEILSHVPESDSFTVRIFADPTSIGNQPKDVTAAEMSALLLSWGATAIEDAQEGGVSFELTAIDALDAPGYLSWGDADKDITFTETAYDPVLGIHVIAMDYSLADVTEKTVLDTLRFRKCAVLLQSPGNITFAAKRTVMISFLEDQVRCEFDIMLGRATYRFPEATIDEALANGGVKEMTFAEFTSTIVDVRE